MGGTVSFGMISMGVAEGSLIIELALDAYGFKVNETAIKNYGAVSKIFLRCNRSFVYSQRVKKEKRNLSN